MTLPGAQRGQDLNRDTPYGEELLAELRRDGFSWRNIARLARSAVRRARDELYLNPALARSSVVWGMVFFTALFVFCAALSLALDHSLAVACLVGGSVWLALSCTWTLVHAGLARTPLGRGPWHLNLPNLLTLFRSQLVPPIVLSAAYGHVVLAGVLFGIGALTDVLDGLAARRLGQITRMGAVMDHLVDVVFFAATFFSFVAAGLLSPWVGVLAGLRYGLVLIGGGCIYVFKGPVEVKPTTFGKVSGFLMSSMLLAQIAASSYVGPPFADHMSQLLHIGFVVILSTAVLQVIVIGWYNLKRASGERAEDVVVGHIKGH